MENPSAESSLPPPPPDKDSTSVGLVWFKCSDLRLLDHEPFSEAHRENKRVVHAFCFDRRWFGPAQTSFGSPSLKTGTPRARFLLEGVADLQSRLRARGSELLVLRGLPEVEIPRLAGRVGARRVYCHREVTYEELQVQAALQRALASLPLPSPLSSQPPPSSSLSGGGGGGAELREYWGNYLYHLDDLPFHLSQMPPVFTQFRKLVETKGILRPPLPLPSKLRPPPTATAADETALPSLEDLGLSTEAQHTAAHRLTSEGEPASLDYRGGETVALARVQEYIWTLDLLKDYKETRNGLLGANYSSKFSPWLATGCLSPRHVIQEIKRYESERVSNESTYWLVFELLWRDFFRFSSLHYGDVIFKLGGPQRRADKFKWTRDMALFEAWREGRTGYPFIDANMRELRATGFMSNRGRQVVASFLTRDMLVDWRLGAAHFEEYLLDYDPCSNYGNWTYVAGVGSDPREDRYFNVVKQSVTYDPEARYMKHWVPEMACVPKEFCHHPFQMDEAVRRKYNVGEEVYPRCVVPLKFSNFSATKAKPFNGPRRFGAQAAGGGQARSGGREEREGGRGTSGGQRSAAPSRADGRASAFKTERARKHRLQQDYMG